MNETKYLPNNKENKLYTPKLILKSIKDAKSSVGSEEEFYNNQKNNKLMEMQYASAFIVAIYSTTGDKYYIYPTENPDFHFIKEDNIKKRQIGFSIEIMTLFDYKTHSFNNNYEQLADLIWEKKGKVDYDRTELLLISRLNCWFNIDKFIDAMKKYNWKYLRIWLGVCKLEYDWNFFEIIPPKGEKNIKISTDWNNIY